MSTKDGVSDALSPKAEGYEQAMAEIREKERIRVRLAVRRHRERERAILDEEAAR